MKRFTETTKWDDPWFRKLSMESKLFWQWLLDHCDHAGVIDPDVELAAFQIGYRKGKANLLESLGDRIAVLPNRKVWILKFIEFQYGKISDKCPAHRPVFKSIERNGLDQLPEGYPKGIPTLKDKDKNKDKDKAKDKDKESATSKARPLSAAECKEYATEIKLKPSDGEAFFEAKEQNGWMAGKVKVRDWKAAMRSWKLQGYHPSQKADASSRPQHRADKASKEYDEPQGGQLKILNP